MHPIDLVLRFRVTFGLLLSALCLTLALYGVYLKLRTGSVEKLSCETFYQDYSQRFWYPSLEIEVSQCDLAHEQLDLNGVSLFGLVPRGASLQTKLKLVIAAKDRNTRDRIATGQPVGGILIPLIGRIMEGVPLSLSAESSALGAHVDANYDMLGVGVGKGDWLGIVIVGTVGIVFLLLSWLTLRGRRNAHAGRPT